MRTFLLVLHIAAVAVWLGANAVQAFAGPRVAKAPQAARLWWAQTQGAMARVLYNVAGVLVLVTGVLLVLREGDDGYEFSTTFVTIGFVAVVIGAALGMAVFGPGGRRLVAAIEEGDEVTEKSTIARLASFGVLDSLVLIVTMVAMVAKWGL